MPRTRGSPAAPDVRCRGLRRPRWRAGARCCSPAGSDPTTWPRRSTWWRRSAWTPPRGWSRRPGSRTPTRCGASSPRRGGPMPYGADATGHFRPYGGRFVPETLVYALDQLEAEYTAAMRDPAFRAELDACLRDFAGRPTPLIEAHRF